MKFYKKPVIFLLILSSFGLITACQNESNPNPDAQKKDDVITKEIEISAPTKTTYKVGEAFSLDGLNVTLFTTTNGVKDEGTSFSEYKVSLEEGYVFLESDVTTADFPKTISVTPNDSSIKPKTFDIYVEEKEKEEVNLTLSEFITKLKNAASYSIDNEIFSAIFIENASYYEVKDAYKSNQYVSEFGWAQNDSQIIRYENNEEGGITKLETYSRSVESDDETLSYSSMFETNFNNYLGEYETSYQVNGAKLITDSDVAKYAEFSPTAANKNLYNIPIKDYGYTPGSSTLTYERALLQLVTNSKIVLNDFAIKNLYGSKISINIELIDENSMKISLANFNASITTGIEFPSETLITIKDGLTLPNLTDFLNNVVDEKEVFYDKISAKLNYFLNYNRFNVYDTSENLLYNYGNYLDDLYKFNPKTNVASVYIEDSFGITEDDEGYESGVYNVTFASDGSVSSIVSYSNLNNSIKPFDYINGMSKNVMDSFFEYSVNDEKTKFTLTSNYEEGTSLFFGTALNYYTSFIDENNSLYGIGFMNFDVSLDENENIVEIKLTLKEHSTDTKKYEVILKDFETESAPIVENFIANLLY